MKCYHFIVLTFILLISFFWMSIIGLWFWLGYESIPCEINKTTDDFSYDFIIVGGGTAGCVLANRLTENKSNSVLLIEAGRNFGPLSILPVSATLMQGTNVDWSLKTINQKYSSKGLFDNQQLWPRGKGLGGSSQLNYMIHFDGDERDFNLWEKKTGPLWNYQNINKYLMKFYNCGSYQTKSAHLLNEETESCLLNDLNKNFMTFNELSDSKLGEIFIQSGLEINSNNYNENILINIAKYNIKNGMRYGVYHQYIQPIFKRSNLHILTNTRVHKIVFKNKRATSVIVSPEKSPSKIKLIKAKREIILSAGAIHSPQILKVSGIGDQHELRKNQIEVIHESPQVGLNLFDHMNLPIFVSILEPESITKTKILSIREWLKYFSEGRGVLSNPGVIGFATSLDNNHGIGLFGMGSVDEKALRAIANYKPNIFHSFFPKYQNASSEGFIFLNTCYQPKSRGSIYLKNKYITSSPLINPNYLQKKYDINCIREAIRLGTKIIQTESFRKIGARINWPKVKGCSNFGPFSNDFITNNPSDQYLDCIIRFGSLTAHHPGGTCAMGINSESVVDEYLRVRGVHNLRVIDGSIFPYPVSGTPNSIIIAVAERAADFILNN